MPHDSSSQQATYFVVLFNLPDDPHAVRDMLVKQLGLHPSDAQIAARAAPGVLPHRFDKATAEALVQQAAQAGVAAEALLAADVPNFEQAEIVHHARCRAEGFEILDYRGQTAGVVPWAEIRVLSVGYIPTDRSRDFHAEPSGTTAVAPHLRHPPTDSALHAGLEAWLVRFHPLQGFRINHDLMNYEYLGDRKSASASQNFRMFIDDVVERAPRLYLTPATRAFREHGLLRHYEFHSSDELRRHTEFHALLARKTASR